MTLDETGFSEADLNVTSMYYKQKSMACYLLCRKGKQDSTIFFSQFKHFRNEFNIYLHVCCKSINWVGEVYIMKMQNKICPNTVLVKEVSFLLALF